MKTSNESDRARRRTQLLEDLLRQLVKHWGRDTVMACLAQIDLPHGDRRPQIEKTFKAKASPSELVSRLNESESRLEALSRIAAAFEAGTFLPSIGHIREFLAMQGSGTAVPKGRSEAFRPLLKVLCALGDDDLQRVSTSEVHAGPTLLAPLSDAIDLVGRNLRGASKEE